MFYPKQKLLWGLGASGWYFMLLGLGAVFSLKNPCYMLSNKSHSLDKVWFTNKLFHSFLSFFTFSLLFIFYFAIHKIKEKATPQNIHGIKGQRFCLSLPTLSFPCFPACCTDRGSPFFPDFFFLPALEKLENAPRRRQNFPFSSF